MPLTAACFRRWMRGNRHPRRTQSAATGLPVYSTLYKGSLTASYDVDIWGVNRSTANAAQASLEAQKPPPLPQI